MFVYNPQTKQYNVTQPGMSYSGKSFAARAFDKVKNTGKDINLQKPDKPSATDYQKMWATLPKKDYRTFGDKLMQGLDNFVKDPWAWATDNPWVAAGGIGALTGLLAGNRGNNNNNQGGYNILNGILPGLLVTGLAYGAFKGIPWLKNKFSELEAMKDKGNKFLDDARKVLENPEEYVKTAGREAGRAAGRSAVDRFVKLQGEAISDILLGNDKVKRQARAAITPRTPKIVDQNGKTIPQGVDSQGNKLVRKEEDVAQGWKPIKDAQGNIIRYVSV